MLNEHTVSKLHEMHLSAMAGAFSEQLSDSAFASIPFEERFGMLVDREWVTRKSNRLCRLIRKAGLAATDACVENIEYNADRNLDKTQIMRLASCNYIQDNRNIIILGATGSGKTYLACAFGMAACREFYAVKYIRLPELLTELAIARSDGLFPKVIKQYKQVKLLIIDEWLLYTLRETEARDLLEIAESRYRNASTILCSQFRVEGWREKIGEPTIGDAICDRIVHESYTVFVDSKDSMRRKKGVVEPEK